MSQYIVIYYIYILFYRVSPSSIDKLIDLWHHIWNSTCLLLLLYPKGFFKTDKRIEIRRYVYLGSSHILCNHHIPDCDELHPQLFHLYKQ